MATAAGPPAGDGLTTLPRLLRGAEGWEAVRAALAAGHSGTIDGAWGSSSALAVAALAESARRSSAGWPRMGWRW